MSDDKSQAERDAHIAWAQAVKVVHREDQAPADRTMADIVEGYAMELLDQLDGSVPRALSAARVACIAAAGEISHPSRWRTAMRAVELCRRAAGLDAEEEAGRRKPPAPGAGPA